jgi:[ribosomal protein S5]-alanine N-acetyltransferase
LSPPLRKPERDDVLVLSQLFTDPRTRQYLGGTCEGVRAQASALELVSTEREYPAWAVMQPGSVEAVGFVSLDRHHDGEDIEVSYILLPEAQGFGLGKAAVASALSEAWRMGLSRIIAETQSANVRSIRLLKSLGFTAERVLIRFGAEQTLFSTQRPNTQ